MPPPHVANEDDLMVWGSSPNGSFNNIAAYESLSFPLASLDRSFFICPRSDPIHTFNCAAAVVQAELWPIISMFFFVFRIEWF